MRALRRRAALCTASWLVAVAPLPAAAAAQSGDVVVRVSDYAFTPATVTVQGGGRVTWDWGGEARHSATADDGSFDTHPACSDEVGLRGLCAASEDPSSTWIAPQVDSPIELTYRCKLHAAQGMRGTVVVVPATADEPSDSASPSPSATATPAPDDEEAGQGGQEPAPEGTPQPTQQGDGPGEPSSGSDRSRGVGAPPAMGTAPMPTDAAPDAPAPLVAGPGEPELEEFPSPSPLPSGDASDAALDDVAVAAPGDGPSRAVVIGIAVAVLLGTAGAFGGLVLFGPPWR